MYIPNKLPDIPKQFYNTACSLCIKSGDINRYGEAVIKELKLMCKFTQKNKRLLTEERNIVVIEATALISGNNMLDNVVDCIFTVSGKEYKIYSCKGIRNPDGSIHHWKLELI